MRVTSGEFSVREPNRQGHECSGSAEHHHSAILATGTPFAEGDAGEVKLSNYPAHWRMRRLLWKTTRAKWRHIPPMTRDVSGRHYHRDITKYRSREGNPASAALALSKLTLPQVR